MNKVDEYLKASEAVEYFTVDGQGKKTLAAFISSSTGKVLIMKDHMDFNKVDALGLAKWIMDIYEPIYNEMTDEDLGIIAETRGGNLDDQSMMTEIRDKHFKIEKGDE